MRQHFQFPANSRPERDAAVTTLRRAIVGELLPVVMTCLGLGSTSNVGWAQVLTGNGPHVFTLSTFVDNVPTVAGSGPLGFGYRTDGKVLVTTSTGEILIYKDHSDNQHAPESSVATRGQSNAQCIAQIQQGNVWKYYLSQDPLGRIVEIDEFGQDVLPVPVVSLPGALCLIPYPPVVVNAHTGHLFATREGSPSIFEIDPIAKTIATFIPNVFTQPDGIAFSPDASVIYAACPSEFVVKGLDTSSQAVVWTSPVTAPTMHPDGIALGIGTLSGYLYTNCNEGEVWEFGLPGGPNPGAMNKIVTGGTRGDFIAADPNVWSGGTYPSLLLTQTDKVLRLDPAGGGWFGPPTSDTAGVLCTTCFPRLCEPGVNGVNACPCSNASIGPGRGCNNFGPSPAIGTGGAGLDASGLASIAGDSVRFLVRDEIVNASNVTVLWQGTGTLAAGAQTGAGVRCVNGTLKRIYKGNAAAGTITFPSGAQPNVHTASSSKGYTIVPPVTLYYYASYRNSAAGAPCGSAALGFNATNAAAVAWSP